VCPDPGLSFTAAKPIDAFAGPLMSLSPSTFSVSGRVRSAFIVFSAGYALATGVALAQQDPQPYGGQPYGNGGAYGGGNGAPTYGSPGGNSAPAARDYSGPVPGPGPRRAADDAYRPQVQGQAQGYGSQPYGNQSAGQGYGSPTPQNDAYNSGRGGYASNQDQGYPPQGAYQQSQNSGYGQPYSPPPDPSDRDYGRGSSDQNYGPGPRRYDERVPDGTYSTHEITDAGRGFFGSVSKGLASVIEHAFKRQGRPNGYILGEEAGGAFVAGLRYGEGTLYTRDAGTHKVYWQGPSLGYDFGGEGSKVMVLVYNLRDPSDIYERFGGVDGSAYLVGGVGITFLSRDNITLAPIRSGIGLRLGANVGYLKYTPRPTWNPF
jgi:hypothetical protein